MGRTVRLTGNDARSYMATRAAQNVFNEKQAVILWTSQPMGEYRDLLGSALRHYGWLKSVPVAGEEWERKRDGELMTVDSVSGNQVSFHSREFVVWDRPLEQFLRNYRKKGEDYGQRTSKASEPPKSGSKRASALAPAKAASAETRKGAR